MLMPGDVAEAMTQPENVWRVLSSPGSGRATRNIERSALYILSFAHRQALARPAHLHPPATPRTRRHRSSARACARHPRRGEPRLEVRLPDCSTAYQSERAPHVRLTSRRRCAIGAIIQTTRPEGRRRARTGAISKAARRDGQSLAAARARRAFRSAAVSREPVLADGRRLDQGDRGDRWAVLCPHSCRTEAP